LSDILSGVPASSERVAWVVPGWGEPAIAAAYAAMNR
jgi:hypothetical protein